MEDDIFDLENDVRELFVKFENLSNEPFLISRKIDVIEEKLKYQQEQIDRLRNLTYKHIEILENLSSLLHSK